MFEELVVELEAAGDNAARQELADAFVAQTLYSEHGFPLRCDGRTGFVVADPGGASVSVAGDFNAWDPASHPLSPAVEGFGLHYAFVDEVLDPGLYKFVFDSVNFVADPLARRYGWDENGEYSLTAARPDASHHERWPDFAESAGDLDARSLEVYVPVHRGDLPVLYMQDGQNLFDPNAISGGWMASVTADGLIGDGSITPVLIVGIPNTPARFDEYTHVQDDLGGGPVGGRADEYAAFVVDGIKPFVDERYPTLSGPEDTTVAGSSLGGLVSLYIAHRDPDVFGNVASMSGTLGWGQIGLANATIAELFEMTPPTGTIVYVDSGGNGPCPGGFDNYCPTLDFADRLRVLGWVDDADLYYHWDPDAPHSEVSWASRFPTLLRDLFST